MRIEIGNTDTPFEVDEENNLTVDIELLTATLNRFAGTRQRWKTFPAKEGLWSASLVYYTEKLDQWAQQRRWKLPLKITDLMFIEDRVPFYQMNVFDDEGQRIRVTNDRIIVLR